MIKIIKKLGLIAIGFSVVKIGDLLTEKWFSQLQGIPYQLISWLMPLAVLGLYLLSMFSFENHPFKDNNKKV